MSQERREGDGDVPGVEGTGSKTYRMKRNFVVVPSLKYTEEKGVGSRLNYLQEGLQIEGRKDDSEFIQRRIRRGKTDSGTSRNLLVPSLGSSSLSSVLRDVFPRFAFP